MRLTLDDGALSVEGLDGLDLGGFDFGDLEGLDGLGERLRERLEGLGDELPRSTGGAVLGVTVEESDEGVTVERVTPGGAAEDAGVRPGDLIRRVDGERVKTVEELRDALRALPADLEAYELELRRGDRALTVDVERRGLVTADAEGFLGRLFGGDAPRFERDDGRGELRPGLERFFDELRRDADRRGRFEFELPSPRALPPSDRDVTPEQLQPQLDRLGANLGGRLGEALEEGLREVLAEALEQLRAEQPAPAVPVPLQPGTDAGSDAEVDVQVFFGRVGELTDDSIVLTGSLGPVTLALTSETQFPAGRPALGDLVTAISSGFVARTVAIVG